MAEEKAQPIVTVNRKAKKQRPQPGVSRAAAERPSRAPRSISDFRDILGVRNKDPEWDYRWVLSTANMDKRIYDALQAGWEFVDATVENELIPGEYAVSRHVEFGSLYRIPASRRNENEWLYLMRIPKDFAEEVQKYKDDKISEQEKEIIRDKSAHDDPETGQYSPEGLKSDIWEEDRYLDK